MNYKITKQSNKSLARLGKLSTPHGIINTPVFMPVGTLGSVKTLSPEELDDIGAEIILSNTYHLYLRPGEKLIKKMGGLHKFIRWDKPILTDSGGYQVFSLGKNLENSKPASPAGGSQTPNPKQITNSKFEIPNNLVKIREDGVEFRSHIDGSKHFFTPKKVIDIQRDLRSDIMMVLDVCTEFPATHKRAKETMELTHNWAKRAIDYWEKLKITNYKLQTPVVETCSFTTGQVNHKSQIPNSKSQTNHKSKIINNKSQLLFGIVQGSTYRDLREESANYISSLPFDGIAVGGVSVGEGKKHMYDVMGWTGANLPKDKPHYIMGIGEPEDIIEAIKNGFDMFDCVLPTRLARHGVVWTKSKQITNKSKFSKSQFQKIDLRKSRYRQDKKPIQEGCDCYACCNGFSRAYISHLIKEHEILGFRLATMHNVYFIISLVKDIREQIKIGNF